MAITTLDGYIAAQKQLITYAKTQANTSVAAFWHTAFDRAGNPGAGTLAVGNTANGVVPTDATTGYPLINAFGGSNRGYIGNIDFGSAVASRLMLMDCVFSCGAYAFNANTTLASIPTFDSRVSYNGGAADWGGLQLWAEIVTNFTGVPTYTITYTNSAGTGSRSTGAFAMPSGAVIGRMFQVPLQAGDSGIKQINTIVGSVASVGTINFHIMRPLWMGRCRVINDGDTHGLDRTGMAEIFADSALRVLVCADSTSTGVHEMQIEIAAG